MICRICHTDQNVGDGGYIDQHVVTDKPRDRMVRIRIGDTCPGDRPAKKVYHFWRSDKYEFSRYLFFDPTLRVAKLEDGRLVNYHFCSSTEDSGVKWSDLVYLGRGTVYSIDGVLQCLLEPLPDRLAKGPKR